MKNQQQEYNKAVKDLYKNSSDRQERDARLDSARTANTTGYFMGKIISGYIAGYCIGTLLGIWFVWVYMIDPFVLPICKAVYDGVTSHHKVVHHTTTHKAKKHKEVIKDGDY